MARESEGILPTHPSQAEEQGRFRVWITPLRSTRFESLNDAQSFAGQLFHDRDHAVILEKLAPSGCWLQLDRLM